MAATIIDGKARAAKLREEVARHAASFAERAGRKAGLAVVLLALVTLVMPGSLPPAERRPAGARAALRSYRALLADRTFLGLVAVAGLAIAGNFTYISASTFVFQEVYRVTPQQYGLLFGLGAVTVTAGTQVTGALLGRVRPGRIVGGALVVAILGSATLLAVPAVVGTGPGRLWPLLAVLLPTIGAVGMTFPAVPTIALGRLSLDPPAGWAGRDSRVPL